jgi:hypothetical protein
VDLRRVRVWDWLAAIAGGVLIVSLFLHWYKLGDTTASGWEAFSVIDLFVLFAGLVGLTVLVATATQRTASVPQTVASLSILPGLVALVLVVFRVLDPPGSGGVTREAGAWIGLVAALTLFFSCWRAMRDQRFPREVAPTVEITPLPPPRPE